jgi:hypothetical protein
LEVKEERPSPSIGDGRSFVSADTAFAARGWTDEKRGLGISGVSGNSGGFLSYRKQGQKNPDAFVEERV